MTNLYVTKEDYQILEKIFVDLPWEIYVFGSRVKGTHQQFSDLDLCFKSNNKISLNELALVRVRLSESDLPFTVDIVDYLGLSDSFKKVIDRDGVNFNLLQPALD